jgi:hypothetical protein
MKSRNYVTTALSSHFRTPTSEEHPYISKHFSQLTLIGLRACDHLPCYGASCSHLLSFAHFSQVPVRKSIFPDFINSRYIKVTLHVLTDFWLKQAEK